MKPDSKNRKRGRPKGSGMALTPSQRAIKSRQARLDQGYKRVEIWLSPLDAMRMEWAKSNGFSWFNRSPEEFQAIIAEGRKLNKERRKQLAGIVEQIKKIKGQIEAFRDQEGSGDKVHLSGIVGQIEGLKTDVEALRDDEEYAYESLPEGIQMSERGDAMQEAVYTLDDAIASLETAVERINSAIG